MGRLFQPPLYLTGILLLVLGFAMLVPAVVDALLGDLGWRVFAAASGTTLAVGGGLLLGNRMPRFSLTVRQAFLATAMVWTTLAAFAAIPFAFSVLALDYADAFFEAMSGLTTTGSTVIVGLDDAPPGLLLWRAMLQWLGGIGVIAMAIAVLPFLRVGGMQLFRTESSDTLDKALPRARRLAGSIAAIYATATALAAIALAASGMTGLDAVCHAMSAIATGGFSTSDASIGRFDDARIELVVIFTMLAGALPFALNLQALRGRPLPLLRDPQVRWFLVACIAATALLALWQTTVLDTDLLPALRLAAFNAVSILTTTGFASADYAQWGTFAVALFFFMTFVGGCSGSTSGGIKIFRLLILFGTVRLQAMRLLRPSAVLVVKLGREHAPDDVTASVMAFLFAAIGLLTSASLLLAAFGLDPVTSLSAAATALANVGPGLGPVIGPAGSFAPLPDGAKWVLAATMLLGRLEIFTVLVLFAPRFWKD